MDNLFYEKYLKYKAKYLALGGVGGVGDTEVLQEISDKLDELTRDDIPNPNPNPNSTVKPDDKKVVQSSPVKSSPLALTCSCEL